MPRSRTILVLGAAVAAALASAGAARPVPERPALRALVGQTVTTTLVFPNAGYGVQGDLKATFRARPLADGTWSVEADFRGQGLSLYVFINEFSGVYCRIRGNADTTTAVPSGVQTQISAPGMYFIHPRSGARINLNVLCTFTVGADGVVSVQTIIV